MVRQIKAEARIAFVSIAKVKSKNIMTMVIYRAGYIEDIEFHEIDDIEDSLEKIKNSRHSKQIRYVVFDIEDGRILNLGDFIFPTIMINKEVVLKGLDESEYEILKNRGHISDGLNICKIISRLIKNYDKVLPKVREFTKA